MSKIKKIKVVELFAGVGGFRVGLEGYPPKKASKYKIVWSNQWEPSTKVQHANQVYRFKFNKYEDSIHSEENITNVQPSTIPIHDMIVGGFPCQDFSVGALNKLSKGFTSVSRETGLFNSSSFSLIFSSTFSPQLSFFFSSPH